jgi:hypothetical protein
MALHSRRIGSGLSILLMAAVSAVLLAGCLGNITSHTGSGGGDDDVTPPGGDDDDQGTIDAGGDPGGDEIDAGEDPGGNDPIDAGGNDQDLVFKQANLTNFTSYPEPGSDECDNFNGCQWEGRFAFVDGKQTENWVMMHNIVAVHSKDADTYALKTLRLRQDGNEIDVTVYDECSDNDCSGCCTQNSQETGFLIDIEKYTMQRFGSGDGIVEFACLDCD